MGKEPDVIRAVQETISRLGGIDIIISNAGYTRFSEFADLTSTTAEDWDTVSHLQISPSRSFLLISHHSIATRKLNANFSQCYAVNVKAQRKQLFPSKFISLVLRNMFHPYSPLSAPSLLISPNLWIKQKPQPHLLILHRHTPPRSLPNIHIQSRRRSPNNEFQYRSNPSIWKFHALQRHQSSTDPPNEMSSLHTRSEDTSKRCIAWVVVD